MPPICSLLLFFLFFFLKLVIPSRRRPFTAHSNCEVRSAPLDRLLLRLFVCTNNLTTLLEMLQLHLKTIQMTTECQALTPPTPPCPPIKRMESAPVCSPLSSQWEGWGVGGGGVMFCTPFPIPLHLAPYSDLSFRRGLRAATVLT